MPQDDNTALANFEPKGSFGQDTIVAISTPPGRGGIGIVRLSGPAAQRISAAMLRTGEPLCHSVARLADVLDTTASAGASARLDQAIVTLFRGPNSYTREDVVEIAAHGSPVVLEAIVRACMDRGARLARPGEFTERAFLAGRIDLTQAEAVRDLIDAQTIYQARIASAQMNGAVAEQVRPVKQGLTALIAELEAGIDFAEDDIDVLPAHRIGERIERTAAPLRTLADSFAYGRLVREGFSLAIVGRPNTGKSSLFNRLVDRERAIVTAAPGTTRDTITEQVSIGGIPMELIDTAGLRIAKEEAERLGIERSRQAMAEADVILLVLDGSADELGAEEVELLDDARGRTAIPILNKADLPQGNIAQELNARSGYAGRAIRTSAKRGDGIAELRAEILARVQRESSGAEGAIVTNLRQQQAIAEALEGLTAADAATDAGVPHEMLLLDLYRALRSLDAVTGETTADDILNLIFSSFCIGK